MLVQNRSESHRNIVPDLICSAFTFRSHLNFLGLLLSEKPKVMTAKNSSRRTALFVAFILFVALSFSARADDVLRATLTNGLQVIIVPNKLAPVVTTMVNYRVGSDECPAGFPGTAHATEHMMFRGSPGLSSDQLAAVSAAMGGDDNADTQQAVTQYFFTTPVENLEVALRIEAARMRDLLPDESLWDKERGAIEQEVAQDLSNPEYVFYEQLLAAMFKGSPYEHDPLGTRPSFDKTTSADLRKFHNTWYVPNNAILLIVGDVEPQTALGTVRKVFGAVPSSPLPARPQYDFSPVKPDTLKLDTDLPYGLSAVVFRFPGTDNPDFAAAQILSDVLSSQRGKLYELVPQGRALFAEFSYDTLPHSGLGYAIAGFPAGADPTNLLEQVRNFCRRKSPAVPPLNWWKSPNAAKSSAPNCRKIPFKAWPPHGRRPLPSREETRRTTTSTCSAP